MAELSPKRRRFVEEYCVDFNAAQAAIRAGYAETRARQTGHELVTNSDIWKAIEERLEELSMSAAEAMKRLSDIAAGDVSPFLSANGDGQIMINLGTDEARQNYNLLKKVKQTRRITRGDDYEREEIKTEFEIHDAKSAQVDILKIHGKFVDRIDHTSKGEQIEFINKGLGDDKP